MNMSPIFHLISSFPTFFLHLHFIFCSVGLFFLIQQHDEIMQMLYKIIIVLFFSTALQHVCILYTTICV